MLILWKLFGLLSRNGMGEFFWVMLCNQKEACSLLRLGGGGINCFCIIQGK